MTKKLALLTLTLFCAAGLGLAQGANSISERANGWRSRIRTKPVSVKTVSAPVKKLDPKIWHLQESFEGSFPPAGWTVYDLNGNYIWEQTNAQAHTGTYSAFIEYDCGSTGNDWLITPQVAVQANDTLYFWMRVYDYGYWPDDLYIRLSPTDNQAASFTTELMHLSGPGTFPPADTWQEYAVDLSAYAGQSVYLAFHHTDVCGAGIFIDDVSVGHEFIPGPHDAGVASIDTPATVVVPPSLAFSPSFTIKNFGTTKEGPFTSSYNIYDSTGALVWNYDAAFGDSIAPDSSIQFVLGGSPFTPSPYMKYQAVTYTSLAGDLYPANDTLRKSFRTWDLDVGATAIIAPAGSVKPDSTIVPAVTYHNFATQTADFDAHFDIYEGASITYSGMAIITGLAPGADTTIAFPAWAAPHNFGKYSAIAYTVMLHDLKASNDTLANIFACGKNNILVYEEIADSTFYNTALFNLGMPGVLTTDLGVFYDSLISRKWDLVLVNSYSTGISTEYLDSINSYQANGGSLILFHWEVASDPTHPLWANLGITYNGYDNPDNLYPDPYYSTHQIYQFPNIIDSLMWTDDQWGDEIQLVDTLPGAKKLAYFQNFSDPYNAAIVLNAAGNCIFNAFESDNYHGDFDGDGKIDIVELLENEIIWIMPPYITYTSPDSGNGSVAITDSLVIGFNEPIDTANFAIVCNPDPGSWVAVWNAGLDTVILTHADFDYSTEYTITITAKDLAGKDLQAVNIPNPLVFTTGPSGVSGQPVTSGVPYFLASAAPNPMGSGQTTIAFGLPRPGQVRIEVYNIAGQRVKTLVNGNMNAGYHKVTWNGRNSAGQKVANGVYMYRMNSGDYTATRKLLIVK